MYLSCSRTRSPKTWQVAGSLRLLWALLQPQRPLLSTKLGFHRTVMAPTAVKLYMWVSTSFPHLGTFLQRIRLRTLQERKDHDHQRGPSLMIFALSFPVFSKILAFLAFFLFFPFGCTAHRILIPQPGTEPVFLAAKAWSLNHWTTREFPTGFLSLIFKALIKWVSPTFLPDSTSSPALTFKLLAPSSDT